ncbi:MAG: FliG C-terminal domain-containing protein [Rhizomicrobium sp.]
MSTWPKSSTISTVRREPVYYVVGGTFARQRGAHQSVDVHLRGSRQTRSSSIQTLLRHVEKDKLGLALKGSTDSLRDIFFSNMSERAGKILREDMEAMGPVRLKDVDEAQMRMVNVAKDLRTKVKS